jgi:hypothetical protein
MKQIKRTTSSSTGRGKGTKKGKDGWKCTICTNKFTKDTTDDWGIIYGKVSKIVHGCYFDRTRKLVSFKLLIKYPNV